MDRLGPAPPGRSRGEPAPAQHRAKPPLSTSPALDVAALELRQRFGDPRRALSEIDHLLGAPPLAGVDLVLLSELTLTGYVSGRGDFDLSAFAEPLDGASAKALSELARRHRVALAGPLVEACGPLLYNTLLLFDREGARIGHYRKRHPWYPEFWATPGDLGTPVVELPGADPGGAPFKIAMAICFDVHFLSGDAGPALDEADLLLFPSAWVDPPGEGDLRAELLPAIARRHRVAVANANWGASRPAFRGQGASRILDAGGRVLAAAPAAPGPHVVRATIRRA